MKAGERLEAAGPARPEETPRQPAEGGPTSAGALRGAWALAALAAPAVVLWVGGRTGTLMLERSRLLAARPGLAVLLVWIDIAVLVAALAVLYWTLLRPRSGPRGGPAALEARPAKRGARRLSRGEAILFAAVALTMLAPEVLRIGEVAVGAGDAEYYWWMGWRISRLITSGEIVSMRIPDVVWPYGSSLWLVEGLFPMLVTAFWNFFAGSHLAYNLALMTGTLLNLLAGRRLSQAVSPSRAVWIAGAVAFATAPAIAVRVIGHQNIYFAFTAALFVAEGLRARRGGEARPLRLALLGLAAYLCSFYYLLFGAAAFLLIVYVAPGPRRVREPGRMAAAAGILALLMLPMAFTRLRFEAAERAAGNPVTSAAVTRAFSGDALSVVAQPEGSTFPLPAAGAIRSGFSKNVAEGTVFPGLALLLGAVGLVLMRSSLKVPLLAAAGALWIASLGPSMHLGGGAVFAAPGGRPVDWLPYAVLLEMPGLGALRAPARAGLVLAAVLTAGFALSLDGLLGRLPARRQAAWVMAAVGVMILSNHKLVNATSFHLSPPVHAALEQIRERAGPGDSVARVPADCHDLEHNTFRLQRVHQLPALGCQATHASMPWRSSLDLYASSAELAALRCNQGGFGLKPSPYFSESFAMGDLGGLKEQFGVRFLILDKRLLARDVCARLRPVEELLRSSLQVVGEDPVWVVFDASRELER